MARGFQSLDADLADLQLETILHVRMRERRTRLCSDVDARAGSRGQLLVAGNEVGMEVSLKDVANGNVIRFRSLQINLDVPLRIDHHGLAVGSQHVGRMRQTAQIKLLKVHCLPPPRLDVILSPK